MRRKYDLLTARKVGNALPPGYYLDGGGLYLQVSPALTHSWIFRYTRGGRTRDMGLGPGSVLSLAEARQRAAHCRQLLLDHVDPIDARNETRARLALAATRALTFRECAKAYVEAHKPSWKSAKHADQWANTLETYCGPIIGALPVAQVDTPVVLRVLEPIWTAKPETAGRLRARIEKVLDWATVHKCRSGDNPARWRGHLDKLLAKLDRKRRVQHHPALPYNYIGDFMALLRTQVVIAAKALEFTILTASRTGETIGATWAEFDLAAGVWKIPPARMKGAREHRVPLSPRAIEILQGLNDARNDGIYVFPGRSCEKPLSNMAMLQLLERTKHPELTVHGFRSTFSDWAAECTSYPREVREMALAHAVSNEVEAAYRRGDLFEKRRRLMNEWAKFCNAIAKKADIVPLRAKKVVVGDSRRI